MAINTAIFETKKYKLTLCHDHEIAEKKENGLVDRNGEKYKFVGFDYTNYCDKCHFGPPGFGE